MLDFYLDARSGVSTYMQIVHQVQRAVRCGLLTPGDRLPAAREVVASLAINPITVLKAYTELERGGWVTSRAGIGTFVAETAPRAVAADVHDRLARSLRDWLAEAGREGLDRGAIEALFTLTVDTTAKEHVA
ncbi:MAG TPA: GntR family transcriptional regulator [Mycobacterium sp.]|nr:GntR family transcriptional regulator [Mycobacterium sp.]